MCGNWVGKERGSGERHAGGLTEVVVAGLIGMDWNSVFAVALGEHREQSKVWYRTSEG